jgi:hypothetical protein
MQIILDILFSMQQALQTEYECAIFFIGNIAFGHKFSGTVGQSIEKQESINQVIRLYGYWHRN